MARRTTPKRERWPPAKTKLAALIDEAIVDACGESEQRTAFYTLLDRHLETPFDTKVLGVTVTVERIDMSDDEQIIAICRRGRSLRAIPILDLVFSDDHCPAHVHARHRGEGWIARLEVLVRERRSEVHEHRACQGHSATTRSKPTLERY